MALTKRTETDTVYLQVKGHCLWREIKDGADGQGYDTLDVKNPKTGQIITKYGYRFDTVSGHATKLVKYDTAKKYANRFFGFKLHLIDGTDSYCLDMPYHSQILRRFLRVAPNVDWTLPLSITIFKGKKKDSDKDELGVWFQQAGATVKPYFTREAPHDMPAAVYDNDLQQWDFKDQHRWLVGMLQDTTIPAIELAASRVAPPAEPQVSEPTAPEPEADVVDMPPFAADDDDLPF